MGAKKSEKYVFVPKKFSHKNIVKNYHVITTKKMSERIYCFSAQAGH